MNLKDYKALSSLQRITNIRLRLHEWDSIQKLEIKDDTVVVVVTTYQVKVLRREDRYEKRGVRMIAYEPSPLTPAGWKKTFDHTVWDEDFEPFIFDKSGGTRKTAEELEEQREFEKMCYRPGTASYPLDNYDRVWHDPSTPKMEKYW